MRFQFVTSLAVAIVIALGAAACGSSTTPSTVTSIAVTGTVPAIGVTSQFAATATMSDGTTQDVTSLATWQSSNTSDATVSGTGLVTAVAAGTVTVQATYQSVTGSDQITVTQ
jgi:Bacterial Ig-like domain (group 2)